MYWINLGDLRFHLPEPGVIEAFGKGLQAHVRSQFRSGTYRKAEEIQEIVRHQITYCREITDAILSKYASIQLMSFLFEFYSEESDVVKSLREEKLSKEEESVWGKQINARLRAIKYLLEGIVAFGSEFPRVPFENQSLELDMLIVAAEALVGLSTTSDLVHSVLPTRTSLEISPPGSNPFLTFEIVDSAWNNCWRERLIRERRDAQDIRTYIGKTFDHDFVTHAGILDDGFHTALGCSYIQASAIIWQTLAAQTGSTSPNKCVTRSNVIKKISENLQLDPRIVDSVLGAFIISKSIVGQERRGFWDPSIEYRAFRRGIFEIQGDKEPLLVWGRRLAEESFLQLMSGLVFKQVPPEWKGTEEAVERLSQAGSKWFEHTIKEKMRERGVIGQSFLRSIASGAQRVSIPATVGELDFLGANVATQSLILLECKFVQPAYEAKMWRRNLTDFVFKSEGKGSYAAKFRRKIDWVKANNSAVAQALSLTLKLQGFCPNRLCVAMVTLHSTIATCFIEDFPCVTAGELISGIDQHGIWPLNLGLHELS